MTTSIYNSESIIVALSEIGSRDVQHVLTVQSAPRGSRQKVRDSLLQLVERRPGHVLEEAEPGIYIVGYPSGKYSTASDDASVPTVEDLCELAEVTAREVLPAQRPTYGATAIEP